MLKLQFKNHSSDPVWVVDKSFAIGSADDNQLVVNDSSVSLQHARITCNDGTYCLRDLGSNTGVYVNGQRINKKDIHNGDAIRVGEVELLVVDPLVGHKQKHWSLVACSSWLSGQEFALPKHTRDGTIKLGRSSHCDVVFPGTHLSRVHVELRVGEHHLMVRDMDTANGTFINDERVSEGSLYPGDKLRLDVYSFQVLGPVSARPLVSADVLPENPPTTVATTDGTIAEKNWKTRPTSLGNRDEQDNNGRENTALIVAAIILCVAVVGLGLYLLLG